MDLNAGNLLSGFYYRTSVYGGYVCGAPKKTDLIYKKASEEEKETYNDLRASPNNYDYAESMFDSLKRWDEDLSKLLRGFLAYLPRRVSIEDALKNECLKETRNTFEGQLQ